MSVSLKEINKFLENGMLPDCLNFSAQPVEAIDWEKVKYNAFYRSFDYHAQKFPHYESIPGFDKIIQSMADNSKSPLEEIDERMNKIKIDDNNIDERDKLTNISEQ